LRGSGVGYKTGPVGEIVTLEQMLEPGDKGRLAFRGTEWTVINDSGESFKAGQHVQIRSVEGLSLRLGSIEKED
jgi:membrane protein implicated in regulation of membrane protease activity